MNLHGSDKLKSKKSYWILYTIEVRNHFGLIHAYFNKNKKEAHGYVED